MADVRRKDIDQEDTPRSRGGRRRPLWILIGLLAAFVVYAYAFETTDVSLDKISDETRQEQLFRVIRALGQPDLLTYESTETAVDIDYMMPCPPEGFTPQAVSGPFSVSVDPTCADARSEVVVMGSGLNANEEVKIFFVPPNGIELRLDTLRTDSNGSFEVTVRLPNRPDDQAQTIRVVTTQDAGSIFSPVYVEDEDGDLVRSPRWSQNAVETLDKIIETIFLALLATTAGTLIAVPLSFFAAKNLMRDVRIPPLQLGLAIIGVPVGIAVGLIATNAVRTLVEDLPDSALLHGGLTIALAYAAVRLLRVAVPLPGEQRSRTIRVLAQIVVGLLILLAGQTLARFAVIGGAWAAENLGAFDFLGEFVATNGDILAAAFGVAAALAGAVVFGLLGSKLGYQVAGRMAPSARGVIAVTLTAAAGALVALGVGQAIGWLYQIENSQTTVVIPAIVGALIGAAVGVIGVRRGQLGAGLGVYYTSRTIFNTLRSIEPLVMVIVFVIWVGLGPFAGALALGLHTVAALTKLYSEQVESINPGPVEAVRATGATRLQTVVYGVVPQIVAPYISFTMYRWDINVRMSTIIGFGGGGGIGFLLQQNIGLLNYRAAAAQMLAIAIVVASMDYISSRLRERYT